jgi:hypothetical protein
MSHKKTKKRRPLKISIRGEGLEIEAKIDDNTLAEVLADTARRLNGQAPRAPGGTDAAKSPIDELIREFCTSLRKEQLDSLVNLLDMPQKMMFMEIANHASM